MKDLSINEVSKIYGLSKDTLRYYDKEKLLVGKRLENGYRVYGQEEIFKLTYILAMKKVGYTMEEIKFIFSHTENTPECWANLRDFLHKQVEVLNRRKRDIDMMLELIGEFDKVVENQDEAKMFHLVSEIIKE